MNIAFHSHYFVPEIGAPSARIYDLSREWLRSGNQVDVVTCFPNHPVGQIYPGYKAALYMREMLDGIRVHRHWTYVTPNRGFVKKTLGHISYLPSACLTSNRRLGRPDVAVGSSPTFFAAMAAAGAGIQHRVPFVMEIRDLWPAIFVDLGVLRNHRVIAWLERLEMALYKCADKVVTVTEAFRRNLIDRGIPAGKVHTIPNGADTDYWKPCEGPADLRRRLGLENRFVALYIGAHGISHALARILECAVILAESHPQVHFLFVGEGAEKDKLVGKAQEMRLRNVTFHPAVKKDEVRQFYAMADTCLVPLRDVPLFDSFIPSKMFEIMAMGKPIVASVRGEAADILDRSGTAVIVPPEDVRGIASAVQHLCLNPAAMRRMGDAGREFVVQHYSRRGLAAQYMHVLEEALGSYRKAAA